MAFKIDKHIPVPTTERGGSSEAAESIMMLTEEGDSFFIPSTKEERPTIQKRITVMGVQMRKRGKIDFFLVTRRVTEKMKVIDDEGTETEEEMEIDGLRVWRRATSIEVD